MRRIATVLLGLLTLSAGAAAGAKGEKGTKQARPGDVASEYTLTERGDLFRQVGGRKCQVTSRVTDLRVAQHPADPAAVYFVKDGDLRMLVPPAQLASGCPKADVRTVMPGVKKFALVTDPRSPFVLMALDRDDRFQALGADGPVEIRDAADFSMNGCYGQDGRNFSSYAAFVLDRYGMVTRLKGKDASEKTDFARAYQSLEDYKAANAVCAEQRSYR